MSDFQYVGLGFAEFVGQLMTETFEATLNAQQYQLRRFAELQEAIDLEDDAFLQRYVDPQLVLNREVLIAGAPLARQMVIARERQAYILEITEDYEDETIIYKNRLTNYGFDALRDVIDGTIVAEKKASLQALLARMEQARLVIDSGEINAKLELSSLYQSTPTDGAEAGAAVKKRLVAPTAELSLAAGGIKELVNAETLEKTVLMDADMLEQSLAANADSPVRISAKPLPASTSSSVYSEVTIRFKTV
ncbi:hypothetical protein [Thalassolituus marinus]|uniref:Uncharacterized protein n=1 Tax=Thalassolituus marinus TaxID=671053 RepID=A0ABS7ZNS7_9GAMM|nr:hypothetical protein [Thalassolituus marinus]MCA6062131.1 hypothetical protein [Thalassolituus marinus]